MASANMSSQPVMVQPLLDSFVPGFSLISSLFTQYFNIDISFYITGLLAVAAVGTGLRYSLAAVWESLSEYFICTAEVRMDDEMYNYIMAWVASQPFSQSTCRFIAGTRTNSNEIYEEYYDYEERREQREDNDDTFDMIDGVEDYWLNISNREKIKPLRYTPSHGTHIFKFKNQYLTFTRTQEENKSMFWSRTTEQINISCVGRNPRVIKELLEEAQRVFLEKDGNKTIIYRGSKSGSGGDPQWVRCMARPPRPLSTVVLDEAQKNNFIDDIKDYLHPATRRWYSNRGIPYRRGYLFHGPPGTGKTSLCYSVAGLFGLKIYVVSLNSASLTEDGLAGLFQDLPRRCIVLLEDIDTAGMAAKRPDEPAPTDEATIKAKSEDQPANNTNTPPKGISLSALLNIIDGVASAEGRLLVMTTNHIERLDKALRRPGRVDLTIGFGFADTPTIRGLYRAIYTRLEGDLPNITNTAAPPAAAINSSATTTKSTIEPQANGHSVLPNGNPGAPPPYTDHSLAPSAADPKPPAFSESEIDSLAISFGASIPAHELTPAELQGYLLRHKYDPAGAVSGAAEWVLDVRKERVLAGEKAVIGEGKVVAGEVTDVGEEKEKVEGEEGKEVKKEGKESTTKDGEGEESTNKDGEEDSTKMDGEDEGKESIQK